MSSRSQTAVEVPHIDPVHRIWKRELYRYPGNLVRYSSLAIVVLVTITLYYQQYLAGGVATEILRDIHMSFLYYVNITVVASVAGAIASGVAGVTDRYGRANIVTGGVLVTALLVLVAIPSIHSEFLFGVAAVAIGFVEGIILVATPALIRDFSPQLGRASAMGFWTLGPVVGSLVVSAVVTPTFDAHRATTPFGWFYEYRICGIASLVVFAIALVGLRELSPTLRDQLMVSTKDRALIEARAQGMTESDIAAGLRNPFRQMLHLDVIGSAFAIAVFLIIYYIAVGFFPIFFQTVYGYTASQANGIGNYFWAFDAGGLIVIGWLSDRLRVRKPFMIVGGVGAVVCTLVFGLYGTAGSTIEGWASHSAGTNLYAASSGFFIVILILLSLFLAFAFAPWMASFTETVERHNPALTATGLAVWGMILRIVIAIAIVIAPHIVSSVTPVVEKGPVLTAYLSDPTPVKTPLGTTTVGGVASAVAAVDPKTLAALQANPASPALGTATAEISKGLGVSKAQALTDLLAASTVGKPGANPQLTKAITYLRANGPEVQRAKAQEPGQWMNYFWVGVGGEVVFIPLIFLMAGFWDPRRAKRAAEEHEAMVAEEMARLESARP